MATAPFPSSSKSLLAFLCWALASSSFWMVVNVSLRTIAAKVMGDAGQPYEKPSFTVITVHDPSSNLTNVSPGP